MDVFVYGTLTDRATVEGLLPDPTFHGAATLEGLHRVEGAYPTLAPGGRVDGRLLGTRSLERLDAYEGVDAGLYVRVSVPLAESGSTTGAVDVYVGDPARLDVDVTWPGSGSFGERVRAYLVEHEVRIRRGADRQG